VTLVNFLDARDQFAKPILSLTCWNWYY